MNNSLELCKTRSLPVIGASVASQYGDPMLRDSEAWVDYESKLSLSKQKPLIYFYTWNEPSLSVGKLQFANPKRQAELLKTAQQLGLPLYVRPTGGRLVLHGGDICYTFIASFDDPDFGGSLRESYCKVNKYIYDCLKQVPELEKFFGEGLISFNSCDSNSSQARQKNIEINGLANNLNCFDTNVRGEILLGNLFKSPSTVDSSQSDSSRTKKAKLVGSAQAMGLRSFIQQGSIQFNRLGFNNFEPELLMSDLSTMIFDIAKISQRLNTNVQQKH